MHIFTYGSLMFPEIWQRVVGASASADCRSTPAIAHAYARYAVLDATYPGMVASPNMSVSGVLYYDVDEKAVALLDAFEGAEYRRDTIEVVVNTDEVVIACTYIFTAEQRLSNLPWQPQSFQRGRFIRDYCGDLVHDKLGE